MPERQIAIDSLDLEIGLHRRGLALEAPDGETEYSVELRGSRPDSAADVRPEQGLARFDWDGLRQLEPDPAAYGRALGGCLLADPAVAQAFAAARASAQALQVPLRLRLALGDDARELHALRWETLCSPHDGAPLTSDENLPFARYLSSSDWRPVGLRARSELRALLVVANPHDLAEYGLAPLDVPAELERARRALDPIAVTCLPGGEPSARPTLENLLAGLRSAAFDLLYLVCHGRLVRGEPWLWLEDAAGAAARVAGVELAQRLKELDPRQLPRLAVLASCEGAGSAGPAESSGPAGQPAPRVALGPRLVEAGIPAVVAMQGRVSLQTLAECLPVFFAELRRDGQIDRALAVARAVVRGRADFWMPVLFMRLKDGLLWYDPSFRDQHGRKVAFDKWPTLISSIQGGRCTAILGPGLVEPVLGSQRVIAQDWASTYAYPLSPDERASLPQVAQYIGVHQDRPFLLDELGKTLRSRIEARCGGLLASQGLPAAPGLDELISAMGAALRRDDPHEPHAVLAGLPLRVYITTNTDALMADALRAAGRQPVVEVLPWNDELAEGYQDSSHFVTEPSYRPSPERPLVYHLFGRLDRPESIVLTEDDHFEFLKGAARNNELIPKFVQRAMADSALLFLGYQMEDWNFRVLFRSILDQPGNRLYQYSHIAVQIMPEVGRLVSTERALRYLERYLYKGARAEISLYLGSPQEFIKLLVEKLA